jgi:hypothetical protein
MKIDVSPPGPPVCTMFKPGTVLRASGTVRRCSRWMSAAVMTVTELATSVASVGMAVGLYTTVALAAGAATAGGGVEGAVVRADVGAGSRSGADCRGREAGWATTTSGMARSGDALCCAVAGQDQASSIKHVRTVDASRNKRRGPA